MLSKIVAGSILALCVGKALAAVQFGGMNVAGYLISPIRWSTTMIVHADTILDSTLVLVLP